MPKLNGGSKTFLYLIALVTDKFVGSNPIFFEKIPSYRSLGKGKTVPLFSEFTARKQKEKAAIAAWSSRFDSGVQIHIVIGDSKHIAGMLNIKFP